MTKTNHKNILLALALSILLGAFAGCSMVHHAPTFPPGTALQSLVPDLPTPDNPAITVYVTQTGRKYHRVYCRYLSQSSIAVFLAELNEQQYKPCSVCNPPLK